METPPNVQSRIDAEQAEQKAHQRQIEIFRDHIKSALNEANREVQDDGGKPSILAAIDALVSVLAEFIAMKSSRNTRRMDIKFVLDRLKKLVMLRTGGH